MCERCWGKAFTAAYGIGSKTQAGEYERIVASCSCTQAQKRGVVDSFAEGYAAREKEIEELKAEVNDWRESAAKAMRENCGDEEHCTCVGPLRHQLVRQARRIVECEEEVVHRGRLNQLAISLAEEFERAVASRNPVGGMSVSPSGDFIACAQLPSAVKRMAWWAREIRKEQAQLEEEGE